MKQIVRGFIRKIQHRFKKESTSHKVLLLAGGTILAQTINVLVTPILSRLYSPGDFGVLAIYTSLLGILGAFSGLSYHLAIPLPEEDTSAINLLILSYFIHGAWVFIISIVLLLMGEQIFIFLGWEAILRFVWLLPIGVFAMGAYTITSYYALRKEAYRTLGKTKVTQKTLGALVSVALGLKGYSSGLLWGQIVGMGGGVVALVKASVKSPFSVTRKSLIATAKKYKAFPLYQPWGTLLNVLSIEMMPLLLFTFFSEEITGWFAMSLRVVQLPAIFLGQAIGQVYYQRASLSHRRGTLGETTLKTVKSLALLGTFPILSIGFISPVVFPFLFGAQWAIAGQYSLILAPYLLLQFLSSPISTAFLIVEKQKYLFLFQGAMLIIGVFSLFLGYLVGGVFFPIVIYSVGKMVVYGSYLVVIMHFSRIKVKQYFFLLGRELAVASMFLVPVIISSWFFKGLFLPVGVYMVVGIFYVIYVLKRGSSIQLL